jgi:hypothetical protein
VYRVSLIAVVKARRRDAFGSVEGKLAVIASQIAFLCHCQRAKLKNRGYILVVEFPYFKIFGLCFLSDSPDFHIMQVKNLSDF